jgi:hypothetical protein
MEKQIETIPLKAIVELKVSGAFYSRMHQLLITFSAQKKPEEFAEILNRLKTEAPKDEYENHLWTLLTFMIDFEASAKLQDKMVMQDYPKLS